VNEIRVLIVEDEPVIATNMSMYLNNNDFSVSPIGQVGNLPRNAGRGPKLFVFDLNVTKEIRVGRVVIRPSVEFDNVLNKTVFSFGSEFIGPSDVPKRTMRPRQIRIGIKIGHG